MTQDNKHLTALDAAATAGAMPGTSGFTMAAFRAEEVPAGTALYTADQLAALQARVDALEAENARVKRNLNSRDDFIVQSGQWGAFTDQLPNVVEPEIGHCVWYRGWECGYDVDAALWGAEGWRAYKGGADIDAPHTSGRTFKALIEEIDEAERECPSSPDGRHQVDTTMESGPNNCFHCEARMP